MKLLIFVLIFTTYHDYFVSTDLTKSLNKHKAVHENNKNHTKIGPIKPPMKPNMNKKVVKLPKLNKTMKVKPNFNMTKIKPIKPMNKTKPIPNNKIKQASKKQFYPGGGLPYLSQTNSFTTLSPEIITHGEFMNTGYTQSQTEMPAPQTLEETVEPFYPEESEEEEAAYGETTGAVIQETVAPVIQETVAPVLQETAAATLEETTGAIIQETTEIVPSETVIEETTIPPQNPTLLNNAAPAPVNPVAPPNNNINIPPNCTNLINQIANNANSLQTMCNMAKQNGLTQCVNAGMSGNPCADNTPIGIIPLPAGMNGPTYCRRNYAGCKKQCTAQCPGLCCSARQRINKRKDKKNKSKIH